MREIEFRGHESPLFAGEKKKKKPKWLYGSLRNISEEHPQIAEPPMGLWCNVEPETVGQYTGVKDKNGKKIYEGDVVFDGEFTGLIWCFRDSACYTVVYDGMSKNLADDHPELLKVIGNVFDNPEYKKRFGRVFEDEP